MDDSCRRAGAIPFKWEVCPGTPKHVRSASAAAAPPTSSCSSKVAPKLAPPPFMSSPYASPSPYHSPRVSYSYGGRPRGPTAFIDAAPRASSADNQYAAAREAAADEVPAFRCFPLPMLRRKGSGKKGGTGYGSSSSSSGSSFRSDGEAAAAPALRRSASSSLASMPRRNRRSTFGEAKEEVEAAHGWFF